MKWCYSILLIICAYGCRKSDFLNTRPDPSLVVPSTLADYQAILDNDFSMNGEAGYGVVPALGESGADNYFVSNDVYNSVLQPLYKRVYTWDKEVFQNEQVYDWNIPYQSIYMANVVLDGLAQLEVSADELQQYNVARGSALFFRSHLFYQLAQVFVKPYDKDSATTLPGLPLRLTSSLTEQLQRSTMEETYQQIITDLQAAIPLLPAKPVYATQPSKAACYGLLSRTYLTMQDYSNGLLYADSCLQLHNTLINYNSLDTVGYYPFTILNPEVIFQCEMIRAPDVFPVNPNYAFVDTVLVHSYDNTDLRRLVFFKPRNGYYFFNGTYSGYYGLFAGIASDEVYLNRAECYARTGKEQAALDDMNTLLANRYRTGSFIPYTTANTPDVLQLVLEERRKELCYRGLRWSDLRRLNKEGAGIKLQRMVDNSMYMLPANDSRYVYPIPGPVMNLNPLIEQNIR